jgi:predicted ribosomally synthesized peptide with nif11-like leader
MSLETAQQFLTTAESDLSLQAKLHALSNGSKESVLAALVRIAAAEGFVFTPAELESALTKHLAQRKPAAAELSEAALDVVAGGKQNTDQRDFNMDKTQGGFWGTIIGAFFPF